MRKTSDYREELLKMISKCYTTA